MAVQGVLSDYIAKNYKRLLVCVAPPSPLSDDAERDVAEQDAADQDGADCAAAEPNLVTPPAPQRRRRRSATTRSRRARRRHHPQPRAVFEQDGQQLVREDPFRGCVSSRTLQPRHSGDFVVMGCMHV